MRKYKAKRKGVRGERDKNEHKREEEERQE
jgi:hypothetical protein